MNLENQIEAILFHRAEGVKIKKLSKLLEVDEVEINKGLEKLEKNLSNRGVKIVKNNDQVMLGTDPNLNSLILKINKEELNRELGKAGLETLSIVLYKDKVSKKEIDYIRGVNSSYILRNLLIRGLIEKVSGIDNRSAFYQGTLDLYAFMGISKSDELPDYSKVKQGLEMLRAKNIPDDEKAIDSEI